MSKKSFTYASLETTSDGSVFFFAIGYFLSALIGDDPLFNHSLAVHIIDAVLDHVTKVSGEKSLDVFLAGTFDFKALIRDVLLDTVEGCQRTVLALVSETVRKHKFTGSGHLKLDVIKEFHISSEEQLHLEIVFFFCFACQCELIELKVLTGIRTDDLDVGLL